MSSGDELEEILRSDPELSGLMDDAPRRRLQVLVAIPVETPDGKPSLRRLGFRVDAEYFYPASAVKLCAAVATVAKLEDLRSDPAMRQDVAIESRARFIDGEGPSRRVMEATLRGEIEKSLVLSDNDAHNRLLDFVGRDELAERMFRMGLRAARVSQPLGDVTRQNPLAIELLLGGVPIPVAQRIGFEPPRGPSSDGVLVGSAHVDESGRVVTRPMDFSTKNVIPLRELQELLISVVRPDLAETPVLPGTKDRDDILAILGQLPSELKPVRNAKEAQALDTFYKPLHGAVLRALPADRVRVLGKGGRAYGFSVENAYATDATTGRSFFVAATIYANDNGTINDDRYEYETVASPFMVRLGEVLARALLVGPAVH